MGFNRSWTALCIVLMMSRAFTGVYALYEAQFLTGANLSSALATHVALGLPGNSDLIPHPRRSSRVNRRSDPVCASAYLCNEAFINMLQQEQAISLAAASYAGNVIETTQFWSETLIPMITWAESHTQDLPGDAGSSFYLAFAANNYAYVTQLVNNGAIGLYTILTNPAGTVTFSALFSLSGLNAILPYCDDTTLDAVAERIASLVDAFLSQFINTNEGDTFSPVVVAANVDGDTGDLDGISVGGSFELSSVPEDLEEYCPAFGSTW